MPFKLTLSAFAPGGSIPRLHSGEGAGLSPSLEWSGEPAHTAAYALIVDDPDAPSGTWTHWLLYDIPASLHSLAQGWKEGGPGLAGRNDFGRIGYDGPMPPRRHGPHRYFFRLFALDVPSLGLPAGAKRAELDAALLPHLLAQTEIMGRYERF